MMDTSDAGGDLGFDYESPDEVAAAMLDGIAQVIPASCAAGLTARR